MVGEEAELSRRRTTKHACFHPPPSPQAELARQARDSRVAEVEAENEALKQALQRLEAAAAAVQGSGGDAASGQGGASPGGAAAGSMRVAQLEGEANVLRRKAAELQKGMDRLQQVRGWRLRSQARPCSTQRCWLRGCMDLDAST